jgi:hypothetical protein
MREAIWREAFSSLVRWLAKPARMIKLALLVVFLVNTGIIGFVAERQTDFGALPDYQKLSNVHPGMVALKSASLEKFAAPIKKRAFELLSKGQYSLEDYWEDLERIYRQEEQLGFARGDLSHGLMLNELWKRFREANWEEIKSADFQNPFQADQWKQDLLAGLFWLWGFYLKNLWVAGILFLLWIYEARKSKQEEARKSFSLVAYLLAVIGYPIVLGYFLFKRMGECKDRLLLEMEIRRSKEQLFGWLSPYERKLLQKFSGLKKGRSLLRRQLREDGRIIRHTRLSALLATVLFLVGQAVVFSSHQEALDRVAFSLESAVFCQDSGAVEVSSSGDNSADHFDLLKFFQPVFRESLVVPGKGGWFIPIPSLGMTWLLAFAIDHIPIGD